MRAWMAAFNSGDPAQVTEYATRFEAGQDRVARMMKARDETGGIELVRIEKSDPLHIEAIVKAKEEGRYGRLVIEVTDTDPPSVKRLEIGPAEGPNGPSAEPRLGIEQTVNALEAKASELAERDRFSGALLVARRGEVVLQKAYGLADRDSGQRNNMNTQFRLGSMNKMFTAVAVLQLVGAGKIDLDAPVGRYLPDYPNAELVSKVTIRHLLTHTGGTGDIFTPEYDKHRLEMRALSDYAKLYGTRGLAFQPGTKWSYSNYGFILLGLVIEQVSGVPYYDYVRKHIFEPAGMRDTDSRPEEEAVRNRSAGYMKSETDGAWVSNSKTLPWRGTSAGGGYSSVGDLFRFAQALTAGKLVIPKLLTMMTSEQAGAGFMPQGLRYGFGMMVNNGQEPKWYGHGGGAPGMNGELRIYPGTGVVVAVLSNLDPPAATRLVDFFEQRMPLN